jgi:hypothetical protein
MMDYQPSLARLAVDFGYDLVQELIAVARPCVFTTALVHDFNVQVVIALRCLLQQNQATPAVFPSEIGVADTARGIKNQNGS